MKPRIQYDDIYPLLVDEKLSLSECGRRLGFSASGVREAAKRLNIPYSSDNPLKIKYDIESIRSLIHEGANCRDLAEYLSCNTNTVTQILKKIGIRSSYHNNINNADIISRMVDQGHNTVTIAEVVGTTAASVMRHIKSKGLIYKPDIRTSTPEKELGEYIQGLVAGEAKLQYKMFDIVVESANLAFELDGIYWHAEGVNHDKYNILNKYEKAKKLGWRSIHILDIEWINQKDICKNIIRSALGLSDQTIGARKTAARELSAKESRKFCNQNHIQGWIPSTHYVGLEYEGEIVCYMSFTKSRFGKKYADYELTRLCYKMGTRVQGGASKLFKYYLSMYPGGGVLSYSNRRLFHGEVYTSLGMEHIYDTKPGYQYVKGGRVYSRYSMRGNSVANKLDHYDHDRTYEDNLRLHGYLRLWDAGNGVYVYSENSH